MEGEEGEAKIINDSLLCFDDIDRRRDGYVNGAWGWVSVEGQTKRGYGEILVLPFTAC